MKISPMDVQRQAFGRRFRGYDTQEVRSYLGLLSEELAELLRERDALQQEVGHLRALAEEHRQRETILKNTLLTAQRVSEEIRDGARKQAEVTVGQAELQADKLLDLAQKRRHEIESHLMDLRTRRHGLRTDIRTLITRLTAVLDMQEEAEVEDNLRFLKRREDNGA